MKTKLSVVTQKSVNKALFLILIASGVFLSSCDLLNNKDNYIKSFETFIATTEANVENLSETEWEKIEAKFTKFATETYDRFADKLSAEDQQKIGELKVRFEKIKVKYGINKAGDKLKDGVEQAKGAAEEIFN